MRRAAAGAVTVHCRPAVEEGHWSRKLPMPVTVSYHVLEHMDAAEAILEFSEKNHADQILMGARGSSQMRRFLGSVSSEVASRASCTVTLVRAPNPGAGKQSASELAAANGVT